MPNIFQALKDLINTIIVIFTREPNTTDRASQTNHHFNYQQLHDPTIPEIKTDD